MVQLYNPAQIDVSVRVEEINAESDGDVSADRTWRELRLDP